MGDVLAELIAEANEQLDVTRENMNALLAFSQNAVLPQELEAVLVRVTSSANIIKDLVQPEVPAVVQAADPAVAGQQQASSSASGGPKSSGSSSSSSEA